MRWTFLGGQDARDFAEDLAALGAAYVEVEGTVVTGQADDLEESELEALTEAYAGCLEEE